LTFYVVLQDCGTTSLTVGCFKR